VSIPDQGRTRRSRLILAALIVLTIVSRLAAVFALNVRGEEASHWYEDEGERLVATITLDLRDLDHPGWEYGNIAWHIRMGDGFSIRFNHIFPRAIAPLMKTRWMMPFYPYLVAGARYLSPGSHLALFILQSLQAGATAWILFRLAASLYGARAALFATALFAVYPSFIYSCTIPHPLCLEFTALLLVLWACRAYLARRRPWLLVGCALATLWAIYIRSAWTLLVPITLALIGLTGDGWRAHWRAAVGYCVIVVLGVAPWAARNYAVFGSFGLSNLDFPLWEGHNSLGNPTGYDEHGDSVANVRGCHPEVYKQLEAVMHDGETAVLRVFREAAVEEIRQRPFLNLVVLPAKRAFYFLFWGPYHPKTKSWWTYRLPYLAIFVPAVVGLLMSWRRLGPAARFGFYSVLAVWLAGCATVAVFHYLPRFRMPSELMFLMPAGYFLDQVVSWIRPRRDAEASG